MAEGFEGQGYTLFEITTNREKLDRARQCIRDGLRSGVLVSILDRVFSLNQIVEAHQYMESNQQNGKIIVTVFQKTFFQ
ncbi:zinc-binding dehydrogenase [Phormidium tenue FACHB-886]|nr:zinc-binding dehydrogenase [Phormidium tenue FACHB-886]